MPIIYYWHTPDSPMMAPASTPLMAQASTLVPLQSIIVPELAKSRGKIGRLDAIGCPIDGASVHACAV